LQEREPFVEQASRLFARIDRGEIQGFITATTITNIYYIVCKVAGREIARDAITQILTDLTICPVDRTVLEQAVTLNFTDFEDAVQCACAIAQNLDAIVTRDLTGFVNAPMLVIRPQDLDNIG